MNGFESIAVLHANMFMYVRAIAISVHQGIRE